MQKRLVLVCEDSLCPRKQPDVSGPGLGEAGRYSSGGHGAERASRRRRSTSPMAADLGGGARPAERDAADPEAARRWARRAQDGLGGLAFF